MSLVPRPFYNPRMSNKLRVGVIGVGYLGKIHTRIYHELPEAELVGICDSNPETKIKADEYGTAFFTNHRDLIGKVDAVSIVTPTFTHYAVAKDFLEAGIHTLIEKPITLKLEEANELIEISKRKNLALQVGHLERHNPGFKRITEIIQNVGFLEIHRLGPFTGRINDCGVVLDLMIHDLDILLGLVKSPIKNIDAMGIHVLTPYEDIANVRIRFENGAVANLTASRLTFEKQRRLRVFQENGYLSLDYEAQSCKIIRKIGNQVEQETVDIQKGEPLKEELRFFLNSIRDGSGLGQPDTAARDALALALKIRDSIDEQVRIRSVLK